MLAKINMIPEWHFIFPSTQAKPQDFRYFPHIWWKGVFRGGNRSLASPLPWTAGGGTLIPATKLAPAGLLGTGQGSPGTKVEEWRPEVALQCSFRPPPWYIDAWRCSVDFKHGELQRREEWTTKLRLCVNSFNGSFYIAGRFQTHTGKYLKPR